MAWHAPSSTKYPSHAVYDLKPCHAAIEVIPHVCFYCCTRSSTCRTCSERISECTDSDSLEALFLGMWLCSLTAAIETCYTFPPDQVSSDNLKIGHTVSQKQEDTTGARAAWKTRCRWSLFSLEGVQFGALCFEILFIFSSWIFHTTFILFIIAAPQIIKNDWLFDIMLV